MLVLSRKRGETINVGHDIKFTIVRIGPESVRVGIEAPAHINVVRSEIADSREERPKTDRTECD